MLRPLSSCSSARTSPARMVAGSGGGAVTTQKTHRSQTTKRQDVDIHSLFVSTIIHSRQIQKKKKKNLSKKYFFAKVT
ncbi:hypothetical protein IscW_ISCW002945 [Ixodes scapularis]|uniref:Uncharacterized protein n=1 Tax=Ixodes scapularis TaxID=6945 RepID=B7PCK3_IXOSC|nr:hypothetical protein IscW_ISCW002945 [Ixodes scapularis]|eukprot:XP_002409933.1 hypothetical protein IscW_ISCW002945 [Ixodes scapularis]